MEARSPDESKQGQSQADLLVFMGDSTIRSGGGALIALLPAYRVHPFTPAAGYCTTKDVLKKVRRRAHEGSFGRPPKPVDLLKQNIQQATHVVVSVGGDDFREILQAANHSATETARMQFIQHHLNPHSGCTLHVRDVFPFDDLAKYKGSYILVDKVLYYIHYDGYGNLDSIEMDLSYADKLKQALSTDQASATIMLSAEQEQNLITIPLRYSHLTLKLMALRYIKIIEEIRAINPKAQIILMTPCYPSASQESHAIDPLLRKIGQLLLPKEGPHDPLAVMHELMRGTYEDIFKNLRSSQGIIVADVASSLNPFDRVNQAQHSEPSGVDGGKIAKMLRYLVLETKDQLGSGEAYRFYPEFFSKDDLTQVERTPFAQWQPAHPWDLKEGYSREEEKIFRERGAKDLSPTALLKNLREEVKKFNKNSPMRQAAALVFREASDLLSKKPKGLPKDTEKKWKMSVVLALEVLQTLTTDSSYPGKVALLKKHAAQRALGKADGWRRFRSALAVLAGAALIVLGVAGVPCTGGTSLAVLYAAGGLLSAGGAAFFYRSRQKSLSKATAKLAETARLRRS